MSDRKRIAAALLWSGILAIAWFAYAPALGGVFLLDDVSNLAGLAGVDDWSSATNFALSGDAGPLGRPLALVTFLPQAAAWERTAAPFLTANILLHLGNACLVLWMLYKLSSARLENAGNRTYIAIAASAIWLLMPLLASSSLMIIQRMTTLSAAFVLLGLIGYLTARRSIDDRPKLALIGMSAALAGGTLLAVFTKENGALLPTFVLVIEATLLRTPERLRPSHWRAWKSLFLVLPTIAIVAYLVSRIPYTQDVFLRREFTSWERLLTESRILWEYLFNAFIPQPGQFGPFHDGYPVSRNLMEPVTFAAFSGWVLALALAVLWRRRYPLFAFAVLWFLAGHLLESTVLSLDLYFEHRNYLPILGPVYAVCTIAARASSSRRALLYSGTAAYAVVCAFMLFNLASLWGNPSVAFRYWQERYPNSVYAATAAMAHLQATEGPKATLQALRGFVRENPQAGYLGIHELKLSCDLNPTKDHRPVVEQLDDSLRRVDFSYTPITMLSQLSEVVARTGCRGVDFKDIRRLSLTLLGDEKYSGNAEYNQLHHQLMALTYRYEGNPSKAIGHLRKAMAYKPSTNLNKMMVVTFAGSGNVDAAREFIQSARARGPHNPLKRHVWLDGLDQLAGYLDRVESGVAPEPMSKR